MVDVDDEDDGDEDLSTELKEQIFAKADEAEAAQRAGDFAKARQLQLAAFQLLPEPRYEWAVGEPLIAGAAHCAILEGDAQGALDILRDGLEAPVMNSPTINLRIGQAFFELEKRQEAAGHFLFALLGGGKAIFSEEEPKYYAFAGEALRPPDGCESWDEYEPPDEWPPDDPSEWFELKAKEPDPSQHRGLTPLGIFVLAGLAVLGVAWFFLS